MRSAPRPAAAVLLSASLVGAFALAACSREGGQAAQTAPAAEGDAPARRAGLWETRIALPGGPGRELVTRTCLDEATERRASWIGRRQDEGACAQTTRREGAAFVFEARCEGPAGGMILTEGRATGDFQSAYTVEIVTRPDPAPPGLPAEIRSTLSARWIGECEPDQRPGDVILPNGMSFNLNDPGAFPGGAAGPGGLAPPPSLDAPE